MSVYVYSKLTCSQTYTIWDKPAPGQEISKPLHKIHVQGGTGIATKHLETPTGAIITKVSDDDFDLLLSCDAFQKHVDLGFITYERDKKVNADKRGDNMETDEGSRPRTPDDYKKNGKPDEDKPQPYIGKKKDKRG